METMTRVLCGVGLLLPCLAGGGLAAEVKGSAAINYQNDFDDSPVGVYSEQRLRVDWMAPSWSNGVAEGRVSIVGEPEAFSGLPITHEATSVGADEGR